MMQQKDHLIEKMSYVFKEKDSIITQLKLKINNTTNENLGEDKIDFQRIQERRNSASETEKSMRSLAYLMQKTQYEEKRRTKVNINENVEYLSHSHTETLSGSSTTSIVNKCYDKSWKRPKDGEYEDEERENSYDENFDRVEDQLEEVNNEEEILQVDEEQLADEPEANKANNNYSYIYNEDQENIQNEELRNDDFWRENDSNFYNIQKEEILGTNKLKQEKEHDSSFHRKNLFSEQELEKKREWIKQMK